MKLGSHHAHEQFQTWKQNGNMKMKIPKQKTDASPRLLANGSNGQPTHDEIALCAYSLWERQVRPQNYEGEHWLQAETQLRQSQSQHGICA